jgi:hypothetical protein
MCVCVRLCAFVPTCGRIRSSTARKDVSTSSRRSARPTDSPSEQR